MEHVEYLKKVAAAKNHFEKYIRTGATMYYWAMSLGFLGTFVFPLWTSDSKYTYFSLVVGVLGGLIYLYKTEKNRKEFPRKFPEESDIMAEHDELLK
jgi:hypothetical protein